MDHSLCSSSSLNASTKIETPCTYFYYMSPNYNIIDIAAFLYADKNELMCKILVICIKHYLTIIYQAFVAIYLLKICTKTFLNYHSKIRYNTKNNEKWVVNSSL